ncbi:MAG: sulfate adenylyltransferase [Campylobacter sp.]|nr:sulfate adenylyltransferase [Campylobacter sp.]
MIHLSKENFLDLKYLCKGVFSPLESFMNYDEYKACVYEMKLNNSNVWTLPITLEVENFKNLKNKEELVYENKTIGSICIEDKFKVDNEKELFEIYKTKDEKHPGIAKEKTKSPFRVSGKIELKERFEDGLHKNILKKLFDKNIRSIAGFQTRNPIHRAHEHLQRIALELCDGLFINPLLGWKKKGDFSEAAVMNAYEVMIKKFYPKNRVVLKPLLTAMRYAGGREAIFHALIRRNLGCTHFIIGRDHAGVGDYYGKYEAHELAKELSSHYDLGIELLLLREPYYCSKCQEIVSDKTCSHYNEARIEISGTKIRQDLSEGKIPDETMMRKEISNVILSLGNENIFIKE